MKTEITSQYQASLQMLIDVIKKCPDALWDDKNYKNAYWRIVYHTLFYTDLYLVENEHSFKRWDNHLPNYNRLGGVADDGKPIEITGIYSKDEMISYAKCVLGSVETRVQQVPLTNPSGFEWLVMNRFELHLYNIRHIQHHVGQLIERLHQAGITGIEWLG